MFASKAGRDWAFLERIEYSVSDIQSEYILRAHRKLAARQSCITYGGRKNCSSDTYMPRNISRSKKYFPARSNAPSPSSHRFGFGNRKPGGGGPEGVAALWRVVEKKATVAGEGRRPDANCDDLSSVAAGRPRASIVNGFVVTIVNGVGSLTYLELLSVAKIVVKLDP